MGGGECGWGGGEYGGEGESVEGRGECGGEGGVWRGGGTLLNNAEAVDILGGKSVECSRGKGVMF